MITHTAVIAGGANKHMLNVQGWPSLQTFMMDSQDIMLKCSAWSKYIVYSSWGNDECYKRCYNAYKRITTGMEFNSGVTNEYKHVE
jgi:hypothetical protein